MQDTIVSILHLKGVSIGVHSCVGANKSYMENVSGDVYNYMARQGRITPQTKLLIINVNEHGPHICFVSDLKVKCKAEDYQMARDAFKGCAPTVTDVMKCIHNDFVIKEYHPYIDVPASSNSVDNFSRMVSLGITLTRDNCDFIGSKIWSVIEKHL